jgi:hypothetical protein
VKRDDGDGYDAGLESLNKFHKRFPKNTRVFPSQFFLMLSRTLFQACSLLHLSFFKKAGGEMEKAISHL